MRLKRANEILIDENNNRKFAKTSQLPNRTDNLNPTINEYTTNNSTQLKANTRFVAGQARATINSSLRGCL